MTGPGEGIASDKSIGIEIPSIVLNGEFYANCKRIRYLGNPVSSTDAANKGYVDDAVSGVLPSGGTTGQALLKASNGGETWGSVATMEQVESAIQSALGVIESELATI